MWNEMDRQFKKSEIDNLERPVIIAVSSCRVSKFRDLQLSATSATHSYINPRTQEAQHLHTSLRAKFSVIPPLQVAKYRLEDPEMEKTRNRETMHTLLQQNPASFKIFTKEFALHVKRQSQE